MNDQETEYGQLRRIADALEEILRLVKDSIGCIQKGIKHMSESSEELKRIADALDTIIKMVKEDQERSKKYMEDRKDD